MPEDPDPRPSTPIPPPPYDLSQTVSAIVQGLLHPPPKHDPSTTLLLLLSEISSTHSAESYEDQLSALKYILRPNPNQALPEPDDEEEPCVVFEEWEWATICLGMSYSLQLELIFNFPFGRRTASDDEDMGVMKAMPSWIPTWVQVSKIPLDAWANWLRKFPKPSDGVVGKEFPFPATIPIPLASHNNSLLLHNACIFPRVKVSRVTRSSFQDLVLNGKYRISILDRSSNFQDSSQVDALVKVPQGLTQPSLVTRETIGWRNVYIPEPAEMDYEARQNNKYTLCTWVDLTEETKRPGFMGGLNETVVMTWVVCRLVDKDTGKQREWNMDRDGVEGEGGGEELCLRKVAVVVDKHDPNYSGSKAGLWGNCYRKERLTGVKVRFV